VLSVATAAVVLVGSVAIQHFLDPSIPVDYYYVGKVNGLSALLTRLGRPVSSDLPVGCGNWCDDCNPVGSRRRGEPLVVDDHSLQGVSECHRRGEMESVERPQRRGIEGRGLREHGRIEPQDHQRVDDELGVREQRWGTPFDRPKHLGLGQIRTDRRTVCRMQPR
jgi:hypothetical protein